MRIAPAPEMATPDLNPSTEFALLFVLAANREEQRFDLLALQILHHSEMQPGNKNQQKYLAEFIRSTEELTAKKFARDKDGLSVNQFSFDSEHLLFGIMRCEEKHSRSSFDHIVKVMGIKTEEFLRLNPQDFSLAFSEFPTATNPCSIIFPWLLKSLEPEETLLAPGTPRFRFKEGSDVSIEAASMSSSASIKKNPLMLRAYCTRYGRFNKIEYTRSRKREAADYFFELGEEAEKLFGASNPNELDCERINDALWYRAHCCGLFPKSRSKEEVKKFLRNAAIVQLKYLAKSKAQEGGITLQEKRETRRLKTYKKTDCLTISLHYQVVGREKEIFASQVKLHIGENAPSSSSDSFFLTVILDKKTLASTEYDGESLVAAIQKFTETHEADPLRRIDLSDFFLAEEQDSSKTPENDDKGTTSVAITQKIEAYLRSPKFLGSLFQTLANHSPMPGPSLEH